MLQTEQPASPRVWDWMGLVRGQVTELGMER